MKKTTSIITLAAALGFSALAASPASAATTAYPNCATAAAAGVYNIPSTSPDYAPDLDSDKDGIGCENADAASAPAQNAPVTQAAPAQKSQVSQMPVGAASTGVSQKPLNEEILALGGGLVVAAAAGGTYVLRLRRSRGNQA